MKKQAIIFGLATISILISQFLIGCESPTTGASTSTVQTYTTMSNSRVYSSSIGTARDPVIQEGDLCDSIHVSRMRILLSDMKLHHDESDTEGFGTIKTGAFVLLFTSDSFQFVTGGSIPPTSYDRVKFEIHQYDPLIDLSIDLRAFADFVTSDRNTVIIDGTVYVGGVGYPFTYASRIIVNEQEMFGQSFVTESGKAYALTIDYSATTSFKSGSKVLDPRDGSNSHEIDTGIKASLRASMRLN